MSWTFLKWSRIVTFCASFRITSSEELGGYLSLKDPPIVSTFTLVHPWFLWTHFRVPTQSLQSATCPRHPYLKRGLTWPHLTFMSIYECDMRHILVKKWLVWHNLFPLVPWFLYIKLIHIWMRTFYSLYIKKVYIKIYYRRLFLSSASFN